MAKKSASWAWVLVVILVVMIFAGSAGLPKINLSGFNPFATGETGLVDVNKQLKLAVTDKYAGSAKASKTLTVYDTSLAQLESLTTGNDGTVNTAFTYPSGTQLYVKYTDSNSKMWFDITVPKMNSKDAEAATYNNIPLKVFSIGTYTTDDLRYQGTAISDGGNYNFTLSGTTMTFSYTLANTGSDNTGLMESADPIYKQRWDIHVTVTFSGTGYQQVLTYGFDSDFTLGTTHYVAKHADANAMTKWKIGNDYVAGYTGTWTMQFTLDGTGYAHGGSTTMQITVYAYADPTYAQNHGGNFGTAKVELAEQTVSLLE